MGTNIRIFRELSLFLQTVLSVFRIKPFKLRMYEETRSSGSSRRMSVNSESHSKRGDKGIRYCPELPELLELPVYNEQASLRNKGLKDEYSCSRNGICRTGVRLMLC